MRVGTTPTILYVPDFISEAEEEELLARTYSNTASVSTAAATQTATQIQQKQQSGAGVDTWVTLSSRRLKCWGGQPGEGFEPEPLPGWLEALCDALVRRKVFSPEGRPNHVLLNGKERAVGQTFVKPVKVKRRYTYVHSYGEGEELCSDHRASSCIDFVDN